MTEKSQTIDERLKKHPQLRKRIEAVLDIAESGGTGSDTADAAEERAIIEVRKMGQEIMQGWAKRKAAKEIAKYQETHPEAHSHKKK